MFSFPLGWIDARMPGKYFLQKLAKKGYVHVGKGNKAAQYKRRNARRRMAGPDARMLEQHDLSPRKSQHARVFELCKVLG